METRFGEVSPLTPADWDKDLLGDHYKAEPFCRFHLLKVLSVTPDVQVPVDPASNPE